MKAPNTGDSREIGKSPMTEYQPPKLWTAADIADYLGKSEGHVKKRMIHEPGFPKPVAGVRRNRRWVASDVVAHMTRSSRAA